jgi:hypothetical protein
MQSINWKNEWFPIEDATYLNFAAHAAIPRVALNAVQASVAATRRPHIVDDQSFFPYQGHQRLAQTLAGLATIAYALKWSAKVDRGECVVPTNNSIVLQWYYNRANNEVVECSVVHQNIGTSCFCGTLDISQQVKRK